MVGRVIRAAEAPISLSIEVARRGAVLAGRVAGWAVLGIVRELSPDKRQEPPARRERPAPGSAPTPMPPAAAEEEEAIAAKREPAARIDEEPEAAPVGGSEAAPVGGEDVEAPPVGGEDGAVVEHEPGLGTSVRARSPHSALNNPVGEPDMSEWPDPYDHREDPRDPGDEMVFGGDAGHTQTGATSTSEPHPSHDPEAEPWEGPKRDKVDE